MLLIAAASAVAALAVLSFQPLLERFEVRKADDRHAALLNAAAAEATRASSDAQLRAVALATSPAVQRVLASRSRKAIAEFGRTHPGAYAAVPGVEGAVPPAGRPTATTEVKRAGNVLGRITVLVRLEPVLASLERSAGRAQLLATFGGRIATGPNRGRQLSLTPSHPVDVSIAGERYRALATPLRAGEGGSTELVALTPRSAIADQAASRRNVLVLAVLTLIVAVVLCGSLLMRFVRWRRLQIDREPGRRARQALTLVGDALAATHEPEALLAVILNATIEATGAIGGRLLDGGVEIARVGRLPGDAEHLDLELHDEIGEPGLLQLYAPPQGFSNANVSLARSLAAQASIALQNAHLHRVVERQAATDELTQLANRRAFMDALATEERRANRSGAPFSVVVADLDDFKRINDRFGHQTGDDVLRAFASVIERELRDIDLPARIGGEEFALLLPQTNGGGAVALAERIRIAFADEPLRSDQGDDLRVTSSFGVAAHAPGQSVSTLLGAADLALYRAKAEGKNAVVAAGGRRPTEDRADVR